MHKQSPVFDAGDRTTVPAVQRRTLYHLPHGCFGRLNGLLEVDDMPSELVHLRVHIDDAVFKVEALRICVFTVHDDTHCVVGELGAVL